MTRKNIKPAVKVNEQTLADLRAQMLAAGVRDEQVLMDARRLALEAGTQTAHRLPEDRLADLANLTAAIRGKGVSDRDLGGRS
jgi:hypothetical protein